MQRLPAVKAAQLRYVQWFQLHMLSLLVANCLPEWRCQCWMCRTRVPHLSVDMSCLLVSFGSLLAWGQLHSWRGPGSALMIGFSYFDIISFYITYNLNDIYSASKLHLLLLISPSTLLNISIFHTTINIYRIIIFELGIVPG